jgi:hypothetical protein
MAGRSFGDFIAGKIGKLEAEKAAVGVAPASQAEDLKAKLNEAKQSGDDAGAQQILGQIKQRRLTLSETGISKPTKGKRRVTVDVGASAIPSAAEIKELLTKTYAAPEATPKVTETTTATPEQMKDVAAEVTGWGAEPRNPGQWTPKKVAETPEAKEMEESPEGPSNPPKELASVLMDRLEAHHAHLTSVLKSLPDQLRWHAQQSPYFAPSHSLFADQLETNGEAGLDKPDRLALREKRDLIANSLPGGTKFEVRKRARVIDQNFAASTYGDVGTSYAQEVPKTSRDANKSAALKGIYGEIQRADIDSMLNVPAHIKALTVDLPSRLGKIKEQMNEIRENGVFQSDDPAVNHKAIMDIADSLSTINNSINSSIKTGTKNAIQDTFSGTGLSLIPSKFKNFFGTNLHSKTFEHIKWMGKKLTQKQDGMAYRAHSEPHPEWTPNVNVMPNLFNGKKVTKPLGKDDVMSKLGHIWGLHGKNKFGKRTTDQPREQIEITPENIAKYRDSKEADESGVTARDLGNHMARIVKDYNNGDTAKYKTHELPAHWQPTSGKGGSGTKNIKGSEDPMAARAQQDMYPMSEEAVEAQEKRSKPIEITDSETGETVRVPAGTGGVFVKGTKKKAARSQSILSKEASTSKVARTAAVGAVKRMTKLAQAAERVKEIGTTYDKDGNTGTFAPEDTELLKANPETRDEVFNHIRTHKQLIEKHAVTIREQGKAAIPQEDRKFLGASGMAEAHRRANL